MTEETGQLSPDGSWWWDGAQWVSTVSPDGRWRWDGSRWQVNEVRPTYIGPVFYQPTAETRRVQMAVTVYIAAAVALGLVVTPMTISHSMRASIAASSPGLDPSFMQGFLNVVLGISLAFLVIWQAIMLTGTWKRWRWVYYVLMVFGVFSTLGILSNVLTLAGVGTYANVIPAWAAGMNIVAALGYAALTVWMFMLWRRYKTAWATRAEPL